MTHRWAIAIGLVAMAMAVGCGEGGDTVEWQLTGPPIPDGSTYAVHGYGEERGCDGGAPLFAQRYGPVDSSGRFEVELPDLETWDHPDYEDEEDGRIVFFYVYVDVDGDGQLCPGDLVTTDIGPSGPPSYAELPELITLPMRIATETWTCRPLMLE